jgi:hypothetical protein
LPADGRYIAWSGNSGKDTVVAKVIHGLHALPEKKPQTESGAFIYLLALNAVEEFIRQFPDYSAEIIKYIDLNEK